MPRFLGEKFQSLWHILLYHIEARQTAEKTASVKAAFVFLYLLCICLLLSASVHTKPQSL